MSATAHRVSPALPRRFPRLRATSIEAAIWVAIAAGILVCAAFGPQIAPHDPNADDLLAGLRGSSASHILGTDDAGRDILSRVIVGARAAVIGPTIVAVGAALLSSILGLIAGYRGGWRDGVTMRIIDLMYAVPGLLFMIIILGVVGGGYWVAVGLLVILALPSGTRLVRGATLEQRALPYVDAARTLGVSPRRIMFRHIWPNVLPLIAANIFLDFSASLVALSALSFLGFGAGPGAADWGRMLTDNLGLLYGNAWAVLAPGLALVVTAVAVNQLGDRVYERLAGRGLAR